MILDFCHALITHYLGSESGRILPSIITEYCPSAQVQGSLCTNRGRQSDSALTPRLWLRGCGKRDSDLALYPGSTLRGKTWAR